MNHLRHFAGAAILVACVGCASDGTAVGAAGGGSVATDLRDAGGTVLARATVRQAGANLRVQVEAVGLKAGTYGAHLHMVGRCDPPDFASAGGHWNPTARQHGKDNPAGAHKGDLPNLTVGADGKGRFEFTVDGARLSGEGGLIDADGAAVVVHANPDDYRTDPAGNAGGRIACGVVGAS